MRDPILLGRGDEAPDVCATEDGWCVVWVPIVGVARQPIRLDWYDRAGVWTASQTVYTGTVDGGASPRLAPAGRWIWLAHRAVVDNIMQATVRRIHPDRTVTTDQDGVLGRADGPLALSGDYVAWQDVNLGRVYSRRLTVPLGVRIPVRYITRPTGLSRMDGAMAVFVDEDRTAIDGMFNPVARYGIVVGEGPFGGIVVRTGEGQPHRTLLVGQICGTPRGARNDDGEYAAVCWGGPGVRLVLFSAADLVTT